MGGCYETQIAGDKGTLQEQLTCLCEGPACQKSYLYFSKMTVIYQLKNKD